MSFPFIKSHEMCHYLYWLAIIVAADLIELESAVESEISTLPIL